MKAAGLLLSLLAVPLAPSPLWAEEGLVLGARAQAMGGAGAGLRAGADALFENPAALSGVESPQLAALAGYGGVGGEATHGLALAWPDPSGVLALEAEDSRLASLGSFREQRLAAGLALPLGPRLWAGTRQQLLSADPGSLRGWSMDLGVLWDAAGTLGGGRGVELGLTARDILSQLSWSGGAGESLPPALAAAASFSAWPSGRLVMQADLVDRPDLGRANLWRLGAEQWVWTGHAALRAGYAAGDAAPAQASVGAGLRGPLFGQDWSLDYAALLPTVAGVLGTRHLVTLSLDLVSRVAPGPYQARAATVERDASNGELKAVAIRLYDHGGEAKAWELTLEDERGRVLRTYRGKGTLPAMLDWDGKDEDGLAVASRHVSYGLRIVDAQNRQLTRRASLFPEEALLEDLGGAASSRGRAYGLREESSAPQSRARVRPVLRSAADPVVEGASFDLRHLAARAVKKWSLKVVDERGRTLKRFAGEGRPPKDLNWEGLTDIGLPVPRAARAGFVLRVTDDAGESTETGDILSPEAQAQINPPLAGADLAALAGSLPKCKVKADFSECNCTFHFAYGSTLLQPEDVQTLGTLAKLTRLGGLGYITVRGHTDDVGSAAFNRRLSQQRAEVLFATLKGFKYDPEKSEIEGLGFSLPVAPNSSEEGRGLNRRAEVVVRRPILFAHP